MFAVKCHARVGFPSLGKDDAVSAMGEEHDTPHARFWSLRVRITGMAINNRMPREDRGGRKCLGRARNQKVPRGKSPFGVESTLGHSEGERTVVEAKYTQR